MLRGRLLRQLAATGPGRAGLALFAVLALASAGVVAAFPLDYGRTRWGNPAWWADNPKAVPPAWVAWFRRHRPARHRVLEGLQVERAASPQRPGQGQAASPPAGAPGPGSPIVYSFSFVHDADEPPTFLSLSVSDVTFRSRPPVITAVLTRPDGESLTLYRTVLRGPRPGERPPFRRYETEPLRVLLSAEPAAATAVSRLLETRYGLSVPAERLRGQLEAALFGVPAPDGSFAVLRGPYRAELQVSLADPGDRVGRVRLVVGGSVYGLMGTDALGRDLAQGLLFGLPVALGIGLAASTISTTLGTGLGFFSGYLGGWVDTAIQRAADIVANVPVLPLLIFIVFIGGSQLWLIILVLVAFSWPGLAILVRSMTLQLRSGQEVEAAQALGAPAWRVILRHIFPHTAPFILAQLVFFAPSAILAEAGLSFLGLGDPSIPTWGQILEHGFRTGAVFLGYWWWVVPPGLLIVVAALAFMLVSLGLEPALDPRLRGGRPWRY